ncbi:type I 3-dehydroquinate dehydratase, partial [Salmonella enterica]|uniref:type I 3-dehydroquinate dehydratase n=1 Tax=Salmonella enterica TaxID=28901 RepID=UPI0032995327
KNLIIGEGMPKIIVALMGRDINSVKAEALACREATFDILEWRVDDFMDIASSQSVLTAARVIRDAMPDIPLLFTFRR